MTTKINPAVTTQQLSQGTQVPAGYTAPVVASAAKASTAAAEMPRAGQKASPSFTAGRVQGDKLEQPDTQYSGQSSQQTMGGNPLDFQQAIYQMDQKARNVQDLQDQKNALLGVLYQSNVSPDIMAKLTPEQALAIKTGRRELIDSQVRSINNQIEGRYVQADSALKYINNISTQMQDSQKQLIDLMKDPEGQTFLKNNLTEEGRQTLKNAGIDIDAIAGKNTVAGYDIGSYATDPTHEKKISKLFDDFSNASNNTSIQSYIDSYGNGKSPITADMVISASEEYGVPAPLIMAMMAQDSSFGTAGLATRTKNPGNVGNDDTGNTRTYGSWDDGVRAVAENLAKRKVKETSQGTENSEAYKTQVKLSRIATSDKKDIIDEIDALVQSGASEEEIDNAAVDGLFAKASDDNKKVYNTAEYQISALDDVLNAIDDGSFKQEGGIFGESFKQSLKQFGKTSPYGDSVRALFSAGTAKERKELFGATLTENEQASAGLFLPTTKDNTETLKFKLKTLKEINQIAKKTSLGLRADETIKDLAAERKKELDRLNSGGTQQSSLSPEDQELAKKYNINL